MQLFLFLLRSSKKTVIFAVIAGIISGIANVALLPLIRLAVRPPGPGREPPPPGTLDSETGWLMLQYFGLCLLLVVCQILSQAMLINLARSSVAKLSMHLCRRILSAPLRHLESIGGARLLATLTADVPAISQGLNGVPM